MLLLRKGEDIEAIGAFPAAKMAQARRLAGDEFAAMLVIRPLPWPGWPTQCPNSMPCSDLCSATAFGLHDARRRLHRPAG